MSGSKEEIDSGGMAFPCDFYGEQGMSIRQWYAGMALHGLLADRTTRDQPENFARYAFLLADAMIAEGKK